MSKSVVSVASKAENNLHYYFLWICVPKRLLRLMQRWQYITKIHLTLKANFLLSLLWSFLKLTINNLQQKSLYINKADCIQVITFNIMYAKVDGFSATFAACDSTFTIHDTKWVTLEPTQASNMTWTHHEPSSNIKAGWASQACCEGGNGLKTHFHRLRDTFACHYTEIAARSNQKWFLKTGFFSGTLWSEVWPATGSSSSKNSKTHGSPARGLKTVTCSCLPLWYLQWSSETKIHTGSDEQDLRGKQRELTRHISEYVSYFPTAHVEPVCQWGPASSIICALT